MFLGIEIPYVYPGPLTSPHPLFHKHHKSIDSNVPLGLSFNIMITSLEFSMQLSVFHVTTSRWQTIQHTPWIELWAEKQIKQ